LAKRESDRQRAIQAYHQLACSCWDRLHQGGILIAASCSAHVSKDEFINTVLHATGRPRELWRSQHAEDHAASFTEAHYLKCIALQKL
jgi:23S rRNA (cytosine1962-C5)-methyltransferase